MKKMPKYGEAAKQHAINLREISGFSYPEIAVATKIPPGYVRKLVHEKRAALLTEKTKKVADVTQQVTNESNGVAHEITDEKPAISAAETQVLPKTSVTKPGFFARHFGLMDWVIYTHLVTTAFAIFNALPGVPGAAMAFIYALLLLDALLNVKRAELPIAAEMAANRVVFMELLAGLANAHLINDYLWQNLDKLPFSVYRGVRLTTIRDEALEVSYKAEWVNGDYVGLLSVFLAALMVAAVCHAVFFAKNVAKERTKTA